MEQQPLVLIKTSMSGTLLYSKEFPDIEAIAKELKISKKNAELIQTGHRFPPGKTRVLNKYTIRKKEAPVGNPFEVSFT
jgi:hypothetical protein